MPLIDIRGIDAAFNRYNEKRYGAVRRTYTLKYINIAQVSRDMYIYIYIRARACPDITNSRTIKPHATSQLFRDSGIAFVTKRNVTCDIGAFRLQPR